MSHSEGLPRWLLYSLISSLLCVCGGLCVPVISFLFRTRKNVNTKLVNYGLSLSAGSMITTALYRMLPRSKPESHNGLTVFLGVFVGMSLSLLLNYLVHACASESLIHCAHEPEQQNPDDMHVHEHGHGHGHEHEANSGHALENYESQHQDHPVESDPYQPLMEQGPSEQINEDDSTPLRSDSRVRRKSKEAQLKSKPTLRDLLSTVNATQMGDCCDLNACVPMTKSESFSCIPPTVRLRHSTTSLPLSSDSDQSHVNAHDLLQSNGDPMGLTCLENEIGYDLENLPVYRKNFHSQRHLSHIHHQECGSINSDASHDYGSMIASHHNEHITGDHSHSHHHHHLETPFSKLLSIGMQTCVVITLHKFPEGFIIYYTNQSSDVSKALGFSIFLSLTIHNFVEGFSMTLPFYAAFESKFLAILITTVLGGCSQPLGALIGYLIFHNKKGDKTEQPHMDVYLSVTAGFLLVIGLQMFQTGVGFSQGHHHHQGEAEEEIKENHSSVNTCLKWCCVGVLLILASGLFK